MVSMLWYHLCYGFCRQGRHTGISATLRFDMWVKESTLTNDLGNTCFVCMLSGCLVPVISRMCGVSCPLTECVW